MKVSAVGFLFQNKANNKTLRDKNYTCVIHKDNGKGNYTRNITTSPPVKETLADIVTPETAREDVIQSLTAISDNNAGDKFIGAAIKDGIKETEVRSLFSDKLYAVRTKDSNGKNHFKILNRNHTKNVIADNLDLTV